MDPPIFALDVPWDDEWTWHAFHDANGDAFSHDDYWGRLYASVDSLRLPREYPLCSPLVGLSPEERGFLGAHARRLGFLNFQDHIVATWRELDAALAIIVVPNYLGDGPVRGGPLTYADLRVLCRVAAFPAAFIPRVADEEAPLLPISRVVDKALLGVIGYAADFTRWDVHLAYCLHAHQAGSC